MTYIYKVPKIEEKGPHLCCQTHNWSDPDHSEYFYLALAAQYLFLACCKNVLSHNGHPDMCGHRGGEAGGQGRWG